MTLLSTATCCLSSPIRECPTAFLMKTGRCWSLQTSPRGDRCPQRRFPPLRLPACQIRWIPLRRGVRCRHLRLSPLRLPACQIRWIPLRQGDRCPQRRRLPPCQIRWTPAMMRSWRKTTRGSVRQPFDSRCPVSQSFALLRMTLPSSRWRSRHRVSPLLTLLPLRALLRALHSDDAYDSIINMQLQCMRGTPTWCRCAPGGPAVRNSLHPQAGDEDSRYSNRKGHLHPGQGRIRRGRASRAPTHQPRGVRGA